MSPRVLLVFPLVSTMACVTIDGPRRWVSERPLQTRCEAGRPSAVLDPAVRDRVRLVFSGSEHCTEIHETSYAKDQRRRFSDPVRTVVAGGAGLIVAVPLFALAVVGASSPARAPGLEYPQPAYSNVPGALGEPVAYGILLTGLGAAAGAYEAMKATDRAGTIHVVEQTSTVTMRQRVVRRGTVNAPGLPVGGLQLIAGALELSLDEAQGLAEGELYLDGQRVELPGDTGERLGFLPVCKRALDGYEDGLPSWDQGRRESAWRLAEACDRRGWTFAEPVRATAIAAKH